MNIGEFVKKYKPCEEGVEWLCEFNTLEEAWYACNNPEWMLWAAQALEFGDDDDFRLMLCRCIRETPIGDGRTTWDLLTDLKFKEAMETIEQIIRGELPRFEIAPLRDRLTVYMAQADVEFEHSHQEMDVIEAIVGAVFTGGLLGDPDYVLGCLFDASLLSYKEVAKFHCDIIRKEMSYVEPE